MNRVKFMSQRFSLLLLPAVLFMLASSVGATEDLTWPFDARLMAKEWDEAADLPIPIGDVYTWNTKWDLRIELSTGTDLRFEEVNIHVVQDPADLDLILDRKGRPLVNLFDYKTDYLEDLGTLADYHLEIIPLDTFEICWGANPERCPPDLYIVVEAELRELQLVEVEEGVFEETWVDVPESAYGEGATAFHRLDKNHDQIWAGT